MARGWGQKGSLVISEGVLLKHASVEHDDGVLNLWAAVPSDDDDDDDADILMSISGSVLDAQPIAVSGSQDSLLQAWDIKRGLQKHMLVSHTSSVRAIEVQENHTVHGRCIQRNLPAVGHRLDE
ncbi:hypothetical protein PCANC_20354 [Puccinia coronata f. sp. avenae]|uniref:Uncharacterized protein n=1 Tax=Puccinia coronata f. sp. avenae TaxID=200324 RepID=A0A2N5UG25_9BASI|nr:hypothetical protein PCANC_20354 [Puccinia coronata f. sp. avenae]